MNNNERDASPPPAPSSSQSTSPSPWIRRILVAVDRSTYSVAALSYAATLAEAHEAAVTVLHVIDRADLQLLVERREEIKRIVGALPRRPKQLELRLTSGDASEVIVREARRGRYNLVLVGERGESAEACEQPARALGSIAADLLRRLRAVLPVRADLWGVQTGYRAGVPAAS